MTDQHNTYTAPLCKSYINIERETVSMVQSAIPLCPVKFKSKWSVNDYANNYQYVVLKQRTPKQSKKSAGTYCAQLYTICVLIHVVHDVTCIGLVVWIAVSIVCALTNS